MVYGPGLGSLATRLKIILLHSRNILRLDYVQGYSRGCARLKIILLFYTLTRVKNKDYPFTFVSVDGPGLGRLGARLKIILYPFPLKYLCLDTKLKDIL